MDDPMNVSEWEKVRSVATIHFIDRNSIIRRVCVYYQNYNCFVVTNFNRNCGDIKETRSADSPDCLSEEDVAWLKSIIN